MEPENRNNEQDNRPDNDRLQGKRDVNDDTREEAMGDIETRCGFKYLFSK